MVHLSLLQGSPPETVLDFKGMLDFCFTDSHHNGSVLDLDPWFAALRVSTEIEASSLVPKPAALRSSGLG